MAFEQPGFSGNEGKAKPKDEGSESRRSTDGLSMLRKAGAALLSEFICVMADPTPEEKRKAALTDEAEKKFPTNDKIQKLYVEDRLAKEFPDKFSALDDEKRIELRVWEEFPDVAKGARARDLASKEALSWVRKPAGVKPEDQRLTRDEQAEINVLRWYPQLPEELSKLAIKREALRLDSRKSTLSLEDEAKVDSWIKLPTGPEKDRENLEAMLLRKYRLENRIRTEETREQTAERLYPGSKEAQKIYTKGARPGAETNFLNVWEKFPDPDKFFDDARAIRLKELKREALTPEEVVKRNAYRAYSDSPRRWELFVRSNLNKGIGDPKPFTTEEQAELDAWARFPNPRTKASERGRELEVMQTLKGWDSDRQAELDRIFTFESRPRPAPK